MANKKIVKGLLANLRVGEDKDTVSERNITSEASQTTHEAVAEERPSIEKGCKDGEARTTIILNKDLVKKVKYIALAEGSTIKEKVTEGLTTIVEAWEAENGKIKI